MSIELRTAPASSLSFNRNVERLPPYNAGMNVEAARRLSGRDDVARLASNENPDGCSPAVMAALASPDFQPWRYADPACTALRAAIGRDIGANPALIVCGNGSEEMIAAASRAMLEPGREVVTVVPSFGLHEIEPLASGARVTKIGMTAEFGFDFDALEAALARAPSMLFLSSPWNPVGPALSRAELDRLVAATSPGTLFVLDEAYFEYADPGAPNGIKRLVAAGVPSIVLRTFSKAYGLAGLRVGYAVCSDAEVARVVAAAKTPFNVNAAAQAAALAALEDRAWMEASVARTRAERERVRGGLHALGLRVAPSQTNFLFFDGGRDSADLAADLLADGVIVKAWREPGHATCIRATIGTPHDNDRLLRSLAAHRGRR